MLNTVKKPNTGAYRVKGDKDSCLIYKNNELIGSINYSSRKADVTDFQIDSWRDADHLQQLLNIIDPVNHYEATYSTTLNKGYVTINGFEI